MSGPNGSAHVASAGRVEQGTADSADSAGQRAGAQAHPASYCHDKRFATLQARAALAGVALVRSTDDHDRTVYFASKWAMTRELDSLDAVEDFLRRIRGAKA